MVYKTIHESLTIVLVFEGSVGAASVQASRQDWEGKSTIVVNNAYGVCEEKT